MYKVGWISDTHLGLKTDGIDRTDEIISIFKQFAKHVKKNKLDCMVLGGDLFNASEPSEKLVTTFIGIMNMLSKIGVPIYLMVGNHDAVEDPERTHCFGFVKKLKKKYPNVKLIEDIVYTTIDGSDMGPIKFIFYPHINSALLKSKDLSMTPQEYIEKRTEKLQEKIEMNDQFYVFSHLNIRGIEPASEKYLMRKSTVYLPEAIINENEMGKGVPTIVQGHIHSREKFQNINIVGSPLFCGFGENERDKYFLEMGVPTRFGEKPYMDYIETKCSPFKELHIDLLKKFRGDLVEFEPVKEFLDALPKNAIVKISCNITPENAVYDWENFKEHIEKVHKPRHVFRINPKIVRNKVTRNPLQKPKLSHDKAIKYFVKGGHRKDKEKVYKLAMKTFEDANAQF